MSEMNHLLKPDGSKIFFRKIEDDHILGVKSNIVILGGNEHSQLPQLPQLPAIFGAHQGSKDRPNGRNTKGLRERDAFLRCQDSQLLDLGKFMVDSWWIHGEYKRNIHGTFGDNGE